MKKAKKYDLVWCLKTEQRLEINFVFAKVETLNRMIDGREKEDYGDNLGQKNDITLWFSPLYYKVSSTTFKNPTNQLIIIKNCY